MTGESVFQNLVEYGANDFLLAAGVRTRNVSPQGSQSSGMFIAPHNDLNRARGLFVLSGRLSTSL